MELSIHVADSRIARYVYWSNGYDERYSRNFCCVGWQIINALEIKSKLAEIERLKTEINGQHTRIEKIAMRNAYDAAVNSYALHKIGEYIKAFASMLEAIQHCLQIDEYENFDILLHNLKANATGTHNLFCYESDNEC